MLADRQDGCGHVDWSSPKRLRVADNDGLPEADFGPISAWSELRTELAVTHPSRQHSARTASKNISPTLTIQVRALENCGGLTILAQRPAVWVRIPVVIRAVVVGFAIGMIAANVWPALLQLLSVPFATAGELLFLAGYVFWAAGGGPPKSLRTVRADSFRVRRLSASLWCWGLIAAFAFAATIHVAIVVLFRIVPFPAAAFHHGYDFSFIPTRPLQWLACVISAVSAGVCEETGFRGYMQRPIEERHGPATAIAMSSLFFTLVHLNKDWSLIGMVPIVFGAGVLLGWLAYASGTLMFVMIGHTIMDIGLFSYWWTQIAGAFRQRPVSETGVDGAFIMQCAALVLLVAITLGGIGKLCCLQDAPA